MIKHIFIKRITKDKRPRIVARFLSSEKHQANKLLSEYKFHDPKNEYILSE